MIKIGLVGSSGGHLTHLKQLDITWKQYDRFWVTFDKPDASSYLKHERWYKAYFPTNRNLKNFVRNLFVAFRVLRREKPDILISSGAGVAVPFFFIGKLFGCKLIYIEVFDRTDKSTLTGKLVYPICDCFIVQWSEMKRIYPKAIVLGSIF
jgi:UDP-N-acetylglucosamine:LPS N-acetylglucosamine transferase